MKLRNFKKAIKRDGHYKYREPRILQKMWIYDYDDYAYYDCYNIHGTLSLKTGVLTIKIKESKV